MRLLEKLKAWATEPRIQCPCTPLLTCAQHRGHIVELLQAGEQLIPHDAVRRATFNNVGDLAGAYLDDALKVELINGRMTPNQVRKLAGLPPIPGQNSA